MNKGQLFQSGVELMTEFCERNKLAAPTIRPIDRAGWRYDVCAYYRPTAIRICIPRCAQIGLVGRQWSYPGYTVDRTPYGVIQHELGHHVDFALSKVKGAYFGDFSVEMRKRVREPKLTNYCPNDAEWFAELFRLFVTNSDLLKAIRPETYRYIRELFKPVVDAPWQEVLKDAPERTRSAAANKIAS